MKISKFVLGIIAAACAVVACQENVDPDKIPGELKTFAFLAEDNDTLKTDVVAATIEEHMVVRTKMGGKNLSLVATLTAAEGDVIEVNGNEVVNGKATVDCTYPIDIVVTNSKSGIATAYEVKVGKILALVANKVVAYEEAKCDTAGCMMNISVMFLDKKDDKPVVAYMRKTCERNESGKLELEKYTSVSVVKWNGSSFDPVGKLGLSDNTARNASFPIILGNTATGNLFVAYSGGEVASLLTAKEFTGGEWKTMGTQGFSTKFSTSYGYPEVYNNPKNNQPAFFFTGNDKNVTDNYRMHTVAEYNGSDWGMTHCAVADLPKYGSLASSASSGTFYRAATLNADGAAYAVCSLNLYGYYVIKNTGDGWKVVVKDYKPEGEEYGIPSNLAIKQAPDGSIYVLAASSKSATMILYKLDEENETLVPYSNPLVCAAGSNGAISTKVAFAINPVSGEMVFTADNKFGSLNADTRSWEIVDTPYETNDISCQPQIVFDSKGNGYLCVVSRATDKKYTNGFYLIGMEADVLPE